MAIETTLQPRQKWWNLLYAVICLVLALWGAYDYWYSIPAREAAAAEYESAVATVSELQAQAAVGKQAPGAAQPLSPEQILRYEEANKTLEKFSGAQPTRPAVYDKPVQMWLYIVGCGILGTPWFLWQWYVTARRRFRLDDDGTLHAPVGTIPASMIADIDMSKWMTKSLATVQTTDGRTVVLDDYKYKNMDLIVGAIATRFYPEDWTEDARDLKRLRAKEALEAAVAAAPAAGADPEKSTGA